MRIGLVPGAAAPAAPVQGAFVLARLCVPRTRSPPTGLHLAALRRAASPMWQSQGARAAASDPWTNPSLADGEQPAAAIAVSHGNVTVLLRAAAHKTTTRTRPHVVWTHIGNCTATGHSEARTADTGEDGRRRSDSRPSVGTHHRATG